MTTVRPERLSPDRRGVATVGALATGLLVSVPLWWISGGTGMSVRELQRWVRVVALGALAMLTIGVLLWRSERGRGDGAGLLAGTVWALAADATWFSLAASTAGD
ncbi:hypothetical protein SAMN04489844_2796 [Nocardioides exalbidus]|uniref:Uncharacterized protein n=1 Tax=Nocardioides exalbidus TaxID=402596 RepID=A0A1H4UKL7_9ACTN|nr:hypothetical protein [Nocardioides exalbidus]SEC69442.1 hypothetical protein SAMN04489844_2796 [Nocardioides exalbidus]